MTTRLNATGSKLIAAITQTAFQYGSLTVSVVAQTVLQKHLKQINVFLKILIFTENGFQKRSFSMHMSTANLLLMFQTL